MTISFKEHINESVRNSVDKLISGSLKKGGREFKVDKKLGYTSFLMPGGVSITSDGVGVSLKVDGKEVKYADRPKLGYKDIISHLDKL